MEKEAKKITLIVLTPMLNEPARIVITMDSLIHAFGAFNCKKDEEYAVLRIDYALPDEQMTDAISLCHNNGCHPFIVISDIENDKVHENYIEL